MTQLAHVIAPTTEGDPRGNIGSKEIRNWADSFAGGGNDEVQGANAANGTLIYSLEVPAGQKLVITEFETSLKATAIGGNCCILLVQSDAAVVGGTETILDFHFHAAVGNISSVNGTPSSPIAVIDNSAGTASLYANITIPHASGGAATNDAATQYASGSLGGILYTP